MLRTGTYPSCRSFDADVSEASLISHYYRGLVVLALVVACACYQSCKGDGDTPVVPDPVPPTWAKKLDFGGGAGASAVLSLSTGDLILVGSVTTFDPVNEDLLFCRTSASGTLLSFKTLGWDKSDVGGDIVAIGDGYIISGRTDSRGAGANDVLVVRCTTAGDTVWTRTFGGSGYDWSSSLTQTPDGNFVIVGGSNSFGSGSNDAYALKIDESGQLLWQTTFGGNGYDQIEDLVILPDDAYLVVGSTGSSGAGAFDVYIAKMDASGSIAWSRTYGGIGNDEANAVARLNGGDFVIAGYTDSFGNGEADVFLLRVNTAGDTLWTRTLGGADLDVAYSVIATPDGGCIIAGRTRSFGAGADDVYLAKFTESGDLVWSRTYGGPHYDEASSIVLAVDGSLVVTGMADGTYVYLIRAMP